MIPSGTTLDINGMPGRILANGYAQRNLLNEFGQFGIGIFSTPLNVSSIELFAERITRSKVQLNWESREPNTVLGYDVERRLDRESVYSKRVYVQSKGGNSENEIDRYTYLDENNYPGISYYRLRQFLVNDAPRYTSIKAVKGMGDGSVSVTVFPNPSIGDFNIRIAGTEQSFEGFLLDMKGIVVNRFSMSSQKLLKVHHLAAGTYFLQIQDVFGKGYSFREKIIITHH
jgi:hypothetical protein